MKNHEINQRVIDVSLKIKHYRIQKGYSQQYLADKVAISLSTLRKIEKHEIALTVERLIAIARALDIRVKDLLK